MSTYGRLVGGYALDCQVASSLAELAERFHPDWLARNPFSQVPDGTLHGATDNGDGTFTNPPVAVVPPVYEILSASRFQEVCEQALGGNAVGASRFGAIIRAIEASNDDLVFSISKRYAKSVTFDRVKTASMLTVLINKGVANVTSQERNSILNAWPEA